MRRRDDCHCFFITISLMYFLRCRIDFIYNDALYQGKTVIPAALLTPLVAWHDIIFYLSSSNDATLANILFRERVWV